MFNWYSFSFFFSSRRRHTRFDCDWSSDVCSSDLVGDYVTPTLVGGPSGIMVGNAIQTLFYRVNNIPLGSALSLVMMLVVTLLVCLFLWAVGYRKMQQRAA